MLIMFHAGKWTDGIDNISLCSGDHNVEGERDTSENTLEIITEVGW